MSLNRNHWTGATLAVAGALTLAACGGSSKNTSTAAQPPSTQPLTSPASGSGASGSSSSGGTTAAATVSSAMSANFGNILTNSKGLSLYTATGDTPGKTGCTGECLTFWPPLLLPAGQKPVAGPGVNGLGTFNRPGGGVQVTYHGKPLYTWEKDSMPGQVSGEGVVDSGGTWHVAKVTAAGASTPAPAPATPAPAAGNNAPPTTAAPSGGGAAF